MNSKPTLGSPEKPPRLGAGGLSPSSRSLAGHPARKQVRGPPGARAPPGPALGPRRPTGVDGLWAGALRGLCSAGVFSWSCFSAHSCHTGSDRSCDFAASLWCPVLSNLKYGLHRAPSGRPTQTLGDRQHGATGGAPGSVPGGRARSCLAAAALGSQGQRV